MSHSSFSIPDRALDMMLSENWTAAECCAFMVLCRFTDRTGRYSTAGAGAVSRYLGVGRRNAQAALTRFNGYQKTTRTKTHTPLIVSRQWHCGAPLPGPAEGPGSVQYILDAPEERFWIGAGIVDGFGKFARPLKVLCQCGDTATKMLLALTQAEDMAAFGGVPPNLLFRKYEPNEDEAESSHGYTMHVSTKGDATWATGAFCHRLVGNGKDYEALVQSHFWPAFNALESAGFIYQVATVISRPLPTGTAAPDPTATALYTLHTFNRHGHPAKGEESISGDMARAAMREGMIVAGEGGTFSGRFAYVVPEDHPHGLVGIYRTRFRERTACGEVREGAREYYRRQETAREWLARFNGEQYDPQHTEAQDVT